MGAARVSLAEASLDGTGEERRGNHGLGLIRPVTKVWRPMRDAGFLLFSEIQIIG